MCTHTKHTYVGFPPIDTCTANKKSPWQAHVPLFALSSYNCRQSSFLLGIQETMGDTTLSGAHWPLAFFLLLLLLALAVVCLYPLFPPSSLPPPPLPQIHVVCSAYFTLCQLYSIPTTTPTPIPTQLFSTSPLYPHQSQSRNFTMFSFHSPLGLVKTTDIPLPSSSLPSHLSFLHTLLSVSVTFYPRGHGRRSCCISGERKREQREHALVWLGRFYFPWGYRESV